MQLPSVDLRSGHFQVKTDIEVHHFFTLMLIVLWVKISADIILKYFSYFPQKIDQHFMQIVTLRDKWHEMFCLFSGKKNTKNIINSNLHECQKSVFLGK